MPNSAKMRTEWSPNRSARRADQMPSQMASTTAIDTAITTSSRVGPMRSAISPPTELPLWIEVPKSPVTSPER